MAESTVAVPSSSGNKLALRKERVELGTAIHSAIEICQPLMEACQQEFVLTMPPLPIYLDGDVTRLAQIIANLLSNSAKYTPEKGRIWLHAERQGSDAVISVRDTGMGIPAEMLPRIFEMFAQVNRSDQPQGGLGIGLSLVKRLVDMHNGTITAQSAGPGKGSEFIVRLPIIIDASRPTHNSERPSARAVAAASLRILVVDDNRDSAVSLGMLLRIMGNDIRMAHDGLEAVRVAEEFRPDVVLLDIGLPKINGYEAARRIREQPWGIAMVLIATTGWGQDSDRERSKAAGCDHHLIKPIDTDMLADLLAPLGAAAQESAVRRMARH